MFRKKKKPQTPSSSTYPVLLLRDIIIFPGMIAPLFVGRKKSVAALDKAAEGDKKLLLLTQKNSNDDDPDLDNVYDIGVVGNLIQMLRMPDGTVKVLAEGLQRVKVKRFVDEEHGLDAEVEEIEEIEVSDEQGPDEIEAVFRTIISQFTDYLKLNRRIPPEALTLATQIDDPGKLADTLAAYVPAKISEKFDLLSELNKFKRLVLTSELIEREIGIVSAESKIRGQVKKQIEKSQKDYFMNERLKAIQKELDDEGEEKDELEDFKDRIEQTQLSDEARDKAMGELKKLKSMSPLSAEASVIRNYLDWILSVPWNDPSEIKYDIGEAEDVLEEEHYGLEKVKERILEYLAVQARTKKMRGPILCLVGPPGVGKTSLGRSIAGATGREFAKISLGGMRDEAEIRGHRRTYLGSMPGKVIQSMKKTKHSNPLLMLDEIDKMSYDFRGDPASALLEVLDPEQNSNFNDHYMEIDYDLSDVMFIATANSLNLPRPLMDRMEIIHISGYTEDEKIEIAKKHLIPKILESHGVDKKEWSISKDALLDLIRYYTREAGVRNLEREISGLVRKAVKELLSNKKTKSVKVTAKNLEKYAKVRKYTFGQKEKKNLVGTSTGLAYTETGGDILQIETVSVLGKSGKEPTGNLKDVMKESFKVALSFIRSRSTDFGIAPTVFHKRDIHVHVPEGATPKDGPSAGTAIMTSILSALTGIPVKKDVAMTGEITLRGRVLAIGGLKEKLLAALRSGIKTVLIPEENVKDLVEIPDRIKNHLEIIPVATADDVIKHAFTKKPKAIEWSEEDEIGNVETQDEGEEDSPRVH